MFSDEDIRLRIEEDWVKRNHNVSSIQTIGNSRKFAQGNGQLFLIIVAKEDWQAFDESVFHKVESHDGKAWLVIGRLQKGTGKVDVYEGDLRKLLAKRSILEYSKKKGQYTLHFHKLGSDRNRIKIKRVNIIIPRAGQIEIVTPGNLFGILPP